MRKIFNSIVLLTVLLVAGACSQEEPATLPSGTIRFAIGQEVETGHKDATRSTPAELGKPLADRFTLAIRRGDNGASVYDGKFVESMDLPVGTYDITASHGEDVSIGRDAPYYIGNARATIEAGKAASVTIPCRVGNALVSVRFGRDAEERARFDRFYSDYGVMVRLGSHSMSVTSEQEATSIYFPAGSSPVLTFYGTLRSAEGKQVSFELKSDKLPDVFEAADHAIVTLSLPDPETAAVIDIATVDVETVTIEESIPVSWLPLPQVQLVHSYNGSNCLQGTDITFTDCYPGMKWKAEVTDADGTLYRSIEGTGKLVSACSDNAAGWTFIPAGEYTATFYLCHDDRTVQTGTRTFTVGRPDIRVAASAYTSYSLYRNGDVQGANGCDAYTVYAPAVSVNILPALWQDPRYAATLQTTLGDNAIEAASTVSTAEGMVFSFPNQQNLLPSLDGYALSAAVAFGRAEAADAQTLYITGLPASFAPPTQDAGWSGYGTVSWESGQVRLGRNTVSQPQSITTDRLAVPAGVKIRAPYHVLMHGATVATTLTLTFGAYDYFSERSSGGMFNSKDHDFESVATFTTDAPATQIKANNSYGSGQTCSYIYYLNYYYAE